MRSMRKAILQGDEVYEAFVKNFLQNMFPKGDVPLWVVEALSKVDIHVQSTLSSTADGNSSINLEDQLDGEPVGEE